VVWSLYNHHAMANAQWYAALNDTPGRFGPPIERPRESIREYFLEWLDRDGFPFWSFWENVSSWWATRALPNVMLLHFAQLKSDPAAQIRRIARFLDISVDAQSWPAILDHCSFGYMKAHAANCVPVAGAFWEGGAETFLHKGSNGRWRDTLLAGDCRRYEDMAREKLGDECANWLATGSAPDLENQSRIRSP
jgi:aryl sulfotransferase